MVLIKSIKCVCSLGQYFRLLITKQLEYPVFGQTCANSDEQHTWYLSPWQHVQPLSTQILATGLTSHRWVLSSLALQPPC